MCLFAFAVPSLRRENGMSGTRLDENDARIHNEYIENQDRVLFCGDSPFEL